MQILGFELIMKVSSNILRKMTRLIQLPFITFSVKFGYL